MAGHFGSCVSAASHQSFRLPPPKCVRCGTPAPSTSSRVVIENKVYCADCAYIVEHPDAATITRERGPRKPQVETLF